MPISGIDPRQTCRAWCYFTGTGGLIASYNIASVTRTAAGAYTVAFATPMPQLYYTVSVLARPATSNSAWNEALCYESFSPTRTVNNFYIVNSSSLDPMVIYMSVFA